MSSTDALTGKLLDIINQVQAGIISKAPDALNLILQQARVDAIGDFLSCIGCAIVIYILWKIFTKVKDIKDEDDDTPAVVVFYTWGAVTVSLTCALLIIFTLFNIWEYVAIADPKLFLAHQIINKIMH